MPGRIRYVLGMYPTFLWIWIKSLVNVVQSKQNCNCALKCPLSAGHQDVTEKESDWPTPLLPPPFCGTMPSRYGDATVGQPAPKLILHRLWARGPPRTQSSFDFLQPALPSPQESGKDKPGFFQAMPLPGWRPSLSSFSSFSGV